MRASTILSLTSMLGLVLLVMGAAGYQTTLVNPLHGYISGEPTWSQVGLGAVLLLVSVYARRLVRVA